MVMIPELTNGEFETFSKDGIVLIDFFADWCMPCVMMSPIVEDIGEEFADKVKVGKINVDDNPELSEKFQITSIPAFILLKDGKEVERMIGALTQDELGEIIKKHI